MALIGKWTLLLTAMVAVLVVDLWQSTMAYSEYCRNVIITMSSCLDYITGKSSTPSCCSQLATVVGSQPQCLCEALAGGSSLSVNINQTRALALPNAIILLVKSTINPICFIMFKLHVSKVMIFICKFVNVFN